MRWSETNGKIERWVNEHEVRRLVGVATGGWLAGCSSTSYSFGVLDIVIESTSVPIPILSLTQALDLPRFELLQDSHSTHTQDKLAAGEKRSVNTRGKEERREEEKSQKVLQFDSRERVLAGGNDVCLSAPPLLLRLLPATDCYFSWCSSHIQPALPTKVEHDDGCLPKQQQQQQQQQKAQSATVVSFGGGPTDREYCVI
ncbi:hypothetical protein BKA81DRAFT_426117 [Phyllosticta paracitricarpa]